MHIHCTESYTILVFNSYTKNESYLYSSVHQCSLRFLYNWYCIDSLWIDTQNNSFKYLLIYSAILKKCFIAMLLGKMW